MNPTAAAALTPYEGTSLAPLDFEKLGMALMTWVVTVQRLGHASPASTLDYSGGLVDGPSLMVKDFVAWTAGREDLSPGAGERLAGFVEASGWSDYVVSNLGSMEQADEAGAA